MGCRTAGESGFLFIFIHVRPASDKGNEGLLPVAEQVMIFVHSLRFILILLFFIKDLYFL